METRFTLMRHARTEWNRQRRIQGQTDTPLAPDGERMARGWGAALQGHDTFDVLLSSDLLRACQTAEIANRHLNLPMEKDARLREQDWGDWSGLYVADLRTMREEVTAQERRGYGFCPPGGEDRQAVFHRVKAALTDAAERHPGKHILVTTHNGVLRVLAYKLLGMNFTPDEALPISKDYKLHRILCLEGQLMMDKLNMDF